jgi:hypothetical protein
MSLSSTNKAESVESENKFGARLDAPVWSDGTSPAAVGVALMPGRRILSLDEAEQSVWLDMDDPRLWPTIAGVWALAERLCPP